MYNYILLAVSALLGTGKNMISKYCGKSFSGMVNLFKNNIITAIISVIVFTVQGVEFSFFKNPLAMLLGVFYGVFIMLSQIFLIKAVEYSAAGVCSLIYSMGFIIPILFSVIILNETLDALKIIGLFLIVVSFILVTHVKSKNTQKLYFAFLAMLSSGFVGIIQKLISYVPQKFEINEYLTVAFSVMLICSAIGFFSIKKNNKKHENSKEFLITSALMGVCVAFPNFINTFLAGKMSGVLFFTCVNGGTIILSCVFSLILFKEKLKSIQIVGVILGVLAILLLVF